MRRSAAPSMSAHKRPKFVPPIKCVSITKSDVEQSRPSISPLASKVSNTISPGGDTPDQGESVERAPFERVPEWLGKGNISHNNFENQAIPDSYADGLERPSYFKCLWAVHKARKRKKWEGDAILKVCPRSVFLYDVDGGQIGKSLGCRASELLALSIGNTLRVGSKECELLEVMDESDFLSGRCFSCVSSSNDDQMLVVKPMAKPFINPQKGLSAGRAPVKIIRKPRHSVDDQDAIVFARPPNVVDPVDVVLDPHLSRCMRPHQKDGVIFMYSCVLGMRAPPGLGCILADYMGLGKTLQTIALIWTLLKQSPSGRPLAKRVLVVCPSSLVQNWCDEFSKWLGSERLLVFRASADNQVNDFAKSLTFPVLIISYELAVKRIEELKNVAFDLMVCDEGQRLKNSNIQLFHSLDSLDIKRRVLLTGTPVQNNLLEFYSLIFFCDKHILGSASSFNKVYEVPISVGQCFSATETEKALADERAKQLNVVCRKIILRRSQEVNNPYLPTKTEYVLFCRSSLRQRSLYKSFIESSAVADNESISDSANHLVWIGKLKKLCNHPRLMETNNDAFHPAKPTWNDSGKLLVLRNILRLYVRELHENIVVVSNSTKCLDLLETVLGSDGYSSLVRLDGKVTVTTRQDIVESFNRFRNSSTILLLSLKAGGVGLNLTGARRIVLFDVDWNPANDLQAMARIWRDGQTDPVFVYRLLTTGTIEEKIFQRQVTKQGLSNAVVDLQYLKRSFTTQEMRDLLTLDETTSCLTHDQLHCPCLVDLGVNVRPAELVNSINDINSWEHFRVPFRCGGNAGAELFRLANEDVTFVFRNIAN